MKPKLLCVDDKSASMRTLLRHLATEFNVLTVKSEAETQEVLDHHADIEFVVTNTSALLKLMTEKRELERLSITDPVTFVRNHRFFQEQIEIEIARSDRHGRPLSLLMVDIDHFKEFNDRHGHQTGDSILRAVAQRLVDEVRTLDTVARYGGEEFAILLPDTTFENAMVVAERVRLAFEKTPFAAPPAGLPTFVTLSLGVASAPKHGTESQVLVAAADRALYTAKRQGRNQSVGA